MIGLFLCPFSPIASEQHSSLAPSPKLALLQRSVKINVARKQQQMPALPATGSGSGILDARANPLKAGK
jgi:hypothetical protein